MRDLAPSLRSLPLLFVALAAHAARAQDETWHRDFHLSDLDESVHGLTSFTSGSGPRLVAVGGFQCAGSEVVNHVAAWDGSNWSALGTGLGGIPLLPSCATEFDDGNGPALYVGGRFSTAGGAPALNVARWDGIAWSALGAGVGAEVYVLAGHDNGSGPALYAGGDFSTAGGQPAQNIARWDGASWSALDTGLDGVVRALATYDDGQGPALYAAGNFTHAGGLVAPGIARWDGSAWSSLAPSLQCFVGALAVHDDGTGPALFAAGTFAPPLGPSRHGIARWKQGAWTYVANMNQVANARALVPYDAGQGIGPELHVGGPTFTTGAAWKLRADTLLNFVSTYPSDPSTLLALASVDLGMGPRLVLGGWFTGVDPAAAFQTVVPAMNIADWDGATWTRMGTGGQGLDGGVDRLALLSAGAGSAERVVALGWFTLAGDHRLAGAGQWDGSEWSTLADGRPGIQTLIEDVHAAGSGAFFAAMVHRVQHWDGAAWSRLAGLEGEVKAFAWVDGASGPDLLAAGHFDVDGAPAGQALARWDGASWRALGLIGDAWALASWVPEAGGAAQLAVAGSFDAPLSGSGVAHLQDGTWSWLGGGPVQGTPHTLLAWARGRSTELYLGGQFSAVAGVAARSIARWDGTSWSPLESGVPGDVFALAVRGTGPKSELIVAGHFELAGGVPAWNIARWDGAAWSDLGPPAAPGTNSSIRALAVVGPSIYAGGGFTQAGGRPSSHLALWGP
jgi:hypothetical protein